MCDISLRHSSHLLAPCVPCSGRSEGTAEVIFKEAGDAERALRRYNNVALDGNAMQAGCQPTQCSTGSPLRLGSTCPPCLRSTAALFPGQAEQRGDATAQHAALMLRRTSTLNFCIPTSPTSMRARLALTIHPLALLLPADRADPAGGCRCGRRRGRRAHAQQRHPHQWRTRRHPHGATHPPLPAGAWQGRAGGWGQEERTGGPPRGASLMQLVGPLPAGRPGGTACALRAWAAAHTPHRCWMHRGFKHRRPRKRLSGAKRLFG